MKWCLFYRYPNPAVPWMGWDGDHGGDWHKLRNIAQHLAVDPKYQGVITRIESEAVRQIEARMDRERGKVSVKD